MNVVRKVFSVHDSALQMYMTPFPCINEGEARRTWAQAVNDPKTPMFSNPHDYSIFCIGEFDDSTGLMRPFQAPVLVSDALSVLGKVRRPEDLSPEVRQ